jgi:hypothetical protein
VPRGPVRNAARALSCRLLRNSAVPAAARRSVTEEIRAVLKGEYHDARDPRARRSATHSDVRADSETEGHRRCDAVVERRDGGNRRNRGRRAGTSRNIASRQSQRDRPRLGILYWPCLPHDRGEAETVSYRDVRGCCRLLRGCVFPVRTRMAYGVADSATLRFRCARSDQECRVRPVSCDPGHCHS